MKKLIPGCQGSGAALTSVMVVLARIRNLKRKEERSTPTGTKNDHNRNHQFDKFIDHLFLCVFFLQDICKSLWCHRTGHRCETKFMPAAEGTSCGLDMVRKGFLVPVKDHSSLANTYSALLRHFVHTFI